MRDDLGAPIGYDKTRNGYRYDPENGEHPYELPGLWFNTEELRGLLICQHLLGNIEPGISQEQIKHLQSRIEKLLSQHPEAAKPRLDNTKILTVCNRQGLTPGPHWYDALCTYQKAFNSAFEKILN